MSQKLEITAASGSTSMAVSGGSWVGHTAEAGTSTKFAAAGSRSNHLLPHCFSAFCRQARHLPQATEFFPTTRHPASEVCSAGVGSTIPTYSWQKGCGSPRNRARTSPPQTPTLNTLTRSSPCCLGGVGCEHLCRIPRPAMRRNSYGTTSHPQNARRQTEVNTGENGKTFTGGSSSLQGPVSVNYRRKVFRCKHCREAYELRQLPEVAETSIGVFLIDIRRSLLGRGQLNP